MTGLLSTSYWPNLHYFYYVINSEDVVIEQYDHYQKQSFRNRTQILSANGRLDLSIPILNSAPKQLIKDTALSYRETWQHNHWGALTSAYKNSPYFAFFEDDIHKFYSTRYETLIEYNIEQLNCILKLLKLKKEIRLSLEYEKAPDNSSDLRSKIHPKLDFKNDLIAGQVLEQPYYQTFSSKFQFIPNLSILDLLFNTGLGAVDYLKKAR